MTTITPDITRAVEIDATIGESPIGSATGKRPLWIDVTGRKPHAYDPAARRTDTLDFPAGCRRSDAVLDVGGLDDETDQQPD